MKRVRIVILSAAAALVSAAASAVAPAAAVTPGADVEKLTSEIDAQGLAVRQLKSSNASKVCWSSFFPHYLIYTVLHL